MNSQSDYNIAVGVVSSHMTAVPQPVTRVLEENLPLLADWRKKASAQKLRQLVMKNYKRLDNQNLTCSVYTLHTPNYAPLIKTLLLSAQAMMFPLKTKLVYSLRLALHIHLAYLLSCFSLNARMCSFFSK